MEPIKSIHQTKFNTYETGAGTMLYGVAIMMVFLFFAIMFAQMFVVRQHALDAQIAVDTVADSTAVYLNEEDADYDGAVAEAQSVAAMVKKETGVDVGDIYVDPDAFDNSMIKVTGSNKYDYMSNVNSLNWDGDSDYTVSRAAGTEYNRIWAEITDEETRKILKDAMKSWPSNLDPRRKDLIMLGASLVGKYEYVYGGDRSGSDNPQGTDCSGFVAWTFMKSGYQIEDGYGASTGSFLRSPFTRISPSDLRPGDVGLKNTDDAGPNNHVGIYVGTDSNGVPLWLHNTKGILPPSSIYSGPRINSYGNFQIFVRYTGFSD